MKFGSTAIEYKVFPYTLNVEWWKSVGKEFKNSVLNMTECEKKCEVGEKRFLWSRTIKLADVHIIFL